jgi:hypothetical protein
MVPELCGGENFNGVSGILVFEISWIEKGTNKASSIAQ